tara:strand:- start:308 stop:523 length:216 start_codon:yes stop_codon:yes gene_type:complete
MTSTVYSEFFGMAFWFDEYNDLMYAPSFVDGGYDKDCIGYVSEWDDFGANGEVFTKLLDVIKELITHGGEE